MPEDRIRIKRGSTEFNIEINATSDLEITVTREDGKSIKLVVCLDATGDERVKITDVM
jgi:hypothetical protein